MDKHEDKRKRKYSREGGERKDKMPGSATPRQSRTAADAARGKGWYG